MNINTMRNAEGASELRSHFSYSPVSIEDRGIHASIAANGKVTIRGNVVPVTGSAESEVEYDEVEINSKVIGNVSILLKDTRKVDYSVNPPRYSHSPVSVDYQRGVNVSVKDNGKVVIKVTADNGEFDEVEVSASLIFRLNRLLVATRRISES